MGHVLPSNSHMCTTPSISRNCAVTLRENQQVVERSMGEIPGFGK